MSGTVVNAWSDGVNAWLAVRTTEAAPTGVVEWVASTTLKDSAGNNKPVATLKAELVALISAQRQQQLAGPQAVAISGSVNV